MVCLRLTAVYNRKDAVHAKALVSGEKHTIITVDTCLEEVKEDDQV